MRPVPAWWPLYFEGAAYDERDRRAELADALLAFFTADDAGFALLTAVRACATRRWTLVLSPLYGRWFATPAPAIRCRSTMPSCAR